MLLEQRYTPGLSILSYVLGDEQSKQAVVIDPTRDVEDYIDYARRHNLRITHIVETHVHADFVCGSRELKARLGGEPAIHCSGYGGTDWSQPYADRHVKEGDEITLGKIRLNFLHVPGHTPEHIAIRMYDVSRSKDVPWLMFTGDLLFVGAVGRPDLLGPQVQKQLAHDLHASLFERLADVPDITEIYPAHGAGSLCGKAIAARRSSTLGYERLFSPSLQRKNEEQWVKDLLADMPLAPPYFARMKQFNRDGPAILGPDLPGHRALAVKDVQHRIEQGCVVLDTRSKEAFAAAHIPGSINIGRGMHFATWAGWVLPYDQDIVMVVDRAGDMHELVTEMIRIGLDRVSGYLDGGIEAWEQAGQPVQTLTTISVHDLHRSLGDVPQRLSVLDVRTDEEWKAGHIAGAIHTHGGQLEEKYEMVPKDRPVAVVCGSGYRSSLAASLLQKREYEGVRNVVGGMTAWKAAGLPTTDGSG